MCGTCDTVISPETIRTTLRLSFFLRPLRFYFWKYNEGIEKDEGVTKFLEEISKGGLTFLWKIVKIS